MREGRSAAHLTAVMAERIMQNITTGSIRFTEENFQELDGTQVVVSVPRETIISISLCYGKSVERPILQFVAGITLCIFGFMFGVWPSLGIILGAMAVGEPIVLKPIAYAAPLVLIGVAVILPIFRKSHYLLVTTGDEQRKLTLKDASPAEFLNSARTAGFVVSWPRNSKP